MNQRIAIITNGNYFAQTILGPTYAALGECIAGVLVVTGDYRKRSKLHALFALSVCTAWPYVMYKVFTQIALFGAAKMNDRLTLDVQDAATKKGVPVRTERAVNCQAARDWIRSLNPDIVVSVSCPQLIGKKMLAIPSIASLNIHSSLLPQYAGLAPYFWVLSNGEKKTGVTVHYMTERFDDGHILRQAEVPIRSRDSAFSLFHRLAVVGARLLPEAIELAFRGATGTAQNTGARSYYSHPSWRGYYALRKNGHRLVRLRDIRDALRSGAADVS